ncbi:hypothetical protein [uncultured Thiothrix sp.]|uniref:hypothetical protein n=1 Tax=uncultured Thiothrix sp. TaxID=223185 RepID=UPI0026235A54|nr:hypothetical protein [uncultured Thiothrix sp.]
MNVSERNEDAKYYVNAKLLRAETLQESDFHDLLIGTPEVRNLLTNLIEIHAKGFRGVVLTALVGIHINPEYDPLNDFYGCNPRAIFEEGIWYALTEKGIPCGKSDPLNVAKNISQLNEAWAKGKRPEAAALAAVHFLRMVMESKGKQRATLVDYFFFRLLCYTQQLNQQVVVKTGMDGESTRQIAGKLAIFCVAYPEAGNVPQFVIAKLLASLYADSTITVHGGDESAFGTNTTSKKPAYIWTSQSGEILNLYEITVKKINLKRLDDCIDALRGLGSLSKPVTFICRIPEDTAELALDGNTQQYKGKTFDFIDIREFIVVFSSLLAPANLVDFLGELQAFVTDINISTKTKQGWNKVFQSELRL